MSGQPLPPRIVEAFAINAPDCDPTAPIAGGKTAPFPAASQIGMVDGAASLADGFVPLNMIDPATGGIPPFGVDMNGVLYLLSAWIAYLAAGQLPQYDATLQTAMTGYAVGSRLSQAADPAAVWINVVAGNVTDPDTGGAGWVSSTPLHETLTAAAGATHDQVLANASDQFLDIDTTAGVATFDSFVPKRDGQRLTVSCTGANNLTLGGTGGTAANRIRQSGPLTIQQNDSYTIQYCAAVSRWIVV